MKPREIDVHIDELVLHGFDPRGHRSVADALQNELSTLLAERGVPRHWSENPERIKAGRIQTGATTKPGVIGEQVARAVHERGTR